VPEVMRLETDGIGKFDMWCGLPGHQRPPWRRARIAASRAPAIWRGSSVA